MSGKRILIVDDDPDIVDYVGTVLEDNGYQVSSASTAASAVSVLEESTFDLLVIDVLMPGRSGLDLLVMVRNDPRWCDLPVILFTGDDDVLEDEGKSYHGLQSGIRGADAILGKPLDPAHLLKILEDLGVS